MDVPYTILAAVLAVYVKLAVSIVGKFISLYPEKHPVKVAGKEAIEYAKGRRRNFMLMSYKFLHVIELARESE